MNSRYEPILVGSELLELSLKQLILLICDLLLVEYKHIRDIIIVYFLLQVLQYLTSFSLDKAELAEKFFNPGNLLGY